MPRKRNTKREESPIRNTYRAESPRSKVILDDDESCIATSLNVYQDAPMYKDRYECLEANKDNVSAEK